MTEPNQASSRRGEPGAPLGHVELARLAYLLVGDHGAARAVLHDALEFPSRDEVASGVTGGVTGQGTGTVLAVVREALARRHLVDRTRSGDFWDGGVSILQRLPSDQRVIVALVCGLGHDPHDVALLLGTPQRLVQRRLGAARETLALHLGLAIDDLAGQDAAVRQVAEQHNPAPHDLPPASQTRTRSRSEPRELTPSQPPTTHLPTQSVPLAPPPDPWSGHGSRTRRVLVLAGIAGCAFAVVAVAALLDRGGTDQADAPTGPSPRQPAIAVTPVTPSTQPATATPTLGSATTTAGPTPRTTATPTASGVPAGGATTPASSSTTRRTTRTSRTTTATASATPSTTTPSTTSSPTTVPSGLMRGAASGLCLDAGSDDPVAGTTVVLAECTGGARQTIGTPGGGVITLGGLCLDDEAWGTASGTHVIVWGCTGQDNQGWVSVSGGAFRNRYAGLCMTAKSSAAGSPVTLRTCDGSSRQRWSIT